MCAYFRYSKIVGHVSCLAMIREVVKKRRIRFQIEETIEKNNAKS